MTKLICSKVLASLVVAALVSPTLAQSSRSFRPIDWSGSRWSAYVDCSRAVLTLQPDGTVTEEGMVRATWQADGQVLNVKWPSRPPVTLRMQRVGDFTIADPTADPSRAMPGSEWERCSPTKNNPFLAGWWMEHSVWSGFSDCRVTMQFNPDRIVRLSNGSEGNWWVDQSELKIRIDGARSDLSFRRVGKRLLDTSGGGALTRCN